MCKGGRDASLLGHRSARSAGTILSLRWTCCATWGIFSRRRAVTNNVSPVTPDRWRGSCCGVRMNGAFRHNVEHNNPDLLQL